MAQKRMERKAYMGKTENVEQLYSTFVMQAKPAGMATLIDDPATR